MAASTVFRLNRSGSPAYLSVAQPLQLACDDCPQGPVSVIAGYNTLNLVSSRVVDSKRFLSVGK